MLSNTNTLNLLGMSGSLRVGSLNTAVLETIAERLGGNISMRIFPLNNVPPYNEDFDGEKAPSSVQDLRAAVAATDGVVLCSPEYNYGISGVLKNAIDWISRPALQSPLKDKPALVMSCSPAYTGGARAHAQMRETLSACLARVVARPQVVISCGRDRLVNGRLTEAGNLAFVDAAINDLVQEVERCRSWTLPVKGRD